MDKRTLKSPFYFLATIFLLAPLLLFSNSIPQIKYDGDIAPDLASPQWCLQAGTGAPSPPGEIIIDEGRTAYHHYPGTIWRQHETYCDPTPLALMNNYDGYTAEFGHKNLYNTKDVTKTGSYARGDTFQITDGIYRVDVLFSPEGIRVHGDSHFIIEKETTGIDPTQWYDYKLVCKNGWYDFYIDGNLENHAKMRTDVDDKSITFGAGNSRWFVEGEGYWDYVCITFGITIEAVVDIDPDILNLKSKGKWITAYIELPEGYDVNDIDIETVELQYNDSSVETDWGGVQGTVYMAKFDRRSVISLLNEVTENVELKVTGEVAEISFEGSDTIKVIR